MTSSNGVVVDALGVRVLVTTTRDEVAHQLRGAWAACLADGDGLPDVVVPIGGSSVAESMEHATQQITERAVGCRAGELLMLHACAVANDEGRAVVLVGSSGMGKTTVASTLGRRWRYVTDETAAIDSDGRLLAYPKPLSVKSHLAHKQQMSPMELGLEPASGELRPKAVVLLDRAEDVTSVEIEELRTIPGIALLAEHSSYLGRLDKPLHRLADLVHDARILRVRYAEAADLEPVVSEVLGESA